MKLLVIGTAVQDTIIDNGKVTKNPGGISYTLLTLKVIKEENDLLLLATALPEVIPGSMQPVFDDVTFFHKSPAPSFPSVTLNIYRDKERDEQFDYCDIPISVPSEDLTRFDGIFINMITGFDITLETLRNIRKNYSGNIYIDIHSLARGKDELNRRNFRPVPESEEWLKCADIVQCNENELRTLTPYTSEQQSAEFILNAGVKYLLITKGEDGARMYFKEKGEFISLYTSPEKVRVSSAVGCGDVFGATFFYYFVKAKNAVTSFYSAVKYSGLSAGYSSIFDLINLKKDAISKPD